MARVKMEILRPTIGRRSLVAPLGSGLQKLMEKLVSGIYIFLQLNNQILIGKTKRLRITLKRF